MMAKKTTPGLAAALAAVRASGKAMNKEAAADYKVTLSANQAGVKGLMAGTSLAGRNLLLSNKQNQLGLRAIAARGAGGTGRVANAAARAESAYGSAMGGAIAQQFGPAAAAGKAEGMLAKSLATQGSAQSRAAAQVASIAQQGVAAQAEAAKYALAQAFQARNAIDAQTIASLTGQLYQTAMQYNQQWQLWKKQQKYAARQADQANNLGAAANALTEDAPAVGLAAWQEYKKAYDEAGSDPSAVNINSVATAWADSMGYAPDDPRVAVFVATLQKMKSSGIAPDHLDTTSLLSQAVDTVYGGLPGWSKYSTAVQDSIKAGTTAAFTGYYDLPGGAGYRAPSDAQTAAGARNFLAAKAMGLSDADARQALIDGGMTATEADMAVALAKNPPKPTNQITGGGTLGQGSNLSGTYLGK